MERRRATVVGQSLQKSSTGFSDLATDEEQKYGISPAVHLLNRMTRTFADLRHPITYADGWSLHCEA